MSTQPAPRQITQLPPASAANEIDLLHLRQGTIDKNVTVAKVREPLQYKEAVYSVWSRSQAQRDVLSTNAGGTVFNSTTRELNYFDGFAWRTAGSTKEHSLMVYNNTGSAIPVRTAVYISGYNTGNELFEIAVADNSSKATLPAVGVVREEIPNGSQGYIVMKGIVEGYNFSTYQINDALYVSSSGQLTNVEPAGTKEVQIIGRVLQNTSTGKAFIQGAMSAGGVPNIVQIKQGLEPVTDRASDVGTSAKRFDSVFADQLNLKGVASGFTGSEVISSSAAVQTTDATATKLLQLALAEGEMLDLEITVTGFINGYTSSYRAKWQATARRATSGNVTIIGEPTFDINSDAGLLAISAVAANTTDQTLDLVVTGEAGKVINWVARYTYHKVLSNA